MKINKAIRTIMKQKGMSLSVMGKALRKVDRKTGEVKPLIGNDVSARLNNDNLSFDKALEMLTVLGYEIVIQEKKQGCRRTDQIIIDQQDDLTELTDESTASTPLEPEKTGKRIKLN